MRGWIMGVVGLVTRLGRMQGGIWPSGGGFATCGIRSAQPRPLAPRTSPLPALSRPRPALPHPTPTPIPPLMHRYSQHWVEQLPGSVSPVEHLHSILGEKPDKGSPNYQKARPGRSLHRRCCTPGLTASPSSRLAAGRTGSLPPLFPAPAPPSMSRPKASPPSLSRPQPTPNGRAQSTLLP